MCLAACRAAVEYSSSKLAEREMGTPLSLTWLGPHGHFHGTVWSLQGFSGGNKPAYCIEMMPSCATDRGGSLLGPMCVYRPGVESSVSTVIKIWA